MARPKVLQLLIHGKTLCGKVFGGFVETWNYIVNRSENLRGDKQLDPDNGHITVDNTNPEHPVVKCSGCGGEGGGGGGGGEEEAPQVPSCFDIATTTAESGGETTVAYSLVRCYYNIGGATHCNADIAITNTIANAASGSILAFAKEGYSGNWGARLFADMSALEAFQRLAANYAVPLYVMAGNGAEVSADLRNAPQIQMVEVLS